jgi:hypothetical protein
MSASTDPQESFITAELLARIFRALPSDTVLVGGQALAVWADWYEIDRSDSILLPAVSMDADFLGRKPALYSILNAINNSRLTFENNGKVITALVGEVTIPLPGNNDEVAKVDVIHRVVGIDAEKVRERAVAVKIGEATVNVMHPLDVLQSRVENLKQIADKRTPEGVEQARLAFQVANRFIEGLAKEDARRSDGAQQQKSAPRATQAVEHVVKIATSAAGRFAVKEFGLDFLEALPGETIINPAFRLKRWPQILEQLGKKNSSPASSAVGSKECAAFITSHGLTLVSLNTAHSRYFGAVLWTNGKQAVQEIGHNSAVCHDVTEWPTVMLSGQMLDIKYDDGKVTIVEHHPAPQLQLNPDKVRKSLQREQAAEEQPSKKNVPKLR